MDAAGDYRMGLRLSALGLAIGMAAINTGNNLLYLMLALILALAGVSIAASWWSLRRLQVAPMLPDEATRGEPFTFGVEVTGRFPLLPQTWVRVRLAGLPEAVELSVAVPAASRRGVASVRATVTRRGLYENLSVQALTGYPLDLWLRQVTQPWRGRIAVMPRFDRISRLRIAPTIRGGRGAGVNAPSRRVGGAGTELHNLREYTQSDDARHIDWRSSARTGTLMVREFEREEEKRLDLVLDLQAADPEAFETAVERCAAILDFASRERFDARLVVPGFRRTMSGHEAMRCLAAVAVVTPDARSAAALDTAMGLVRRNGDVVVISADPARATPLEIA